MTRIVALPGRAERASYEIIGTGQASAGMFTGGPGFSAAYMNGDAGTVRATRCVPT